MKWVMVIVAGLRAHVVYDGDVGVIQGSGSSGLLLEPRKPLGVGGVLLRENLDRHLAPQPGVLAEVYLAHTARTEQFEDLVGAEGGADHCC